MDVHREKSSGVHKSGQIGAGQRSSGGGSQTTNTNNYSLKYFFCLTLAGPPNSSGRMGGEIPRSWGADPWAVSTFGAGWSKDHDASIPGPNSGVSQGFGGGRGRRSPKS